MAGEETIFNALVSLGVEDNDVAGQVRSIISRVQSELESIGNMPGMDLGAKMAASMLEGTSSIAAGVGRMGQALSEVKRDLADLEGLSRVGQTFNTDAQTRALREMNALLDVTIERFREVGRARGNLTFEPTPFNLGRQVPPGQTPIGTAYEANIPREVQDRIFANVGAEAARSLNPALQQVAKSFEENLKPTLEAIGKAGEDLKAAVRSGNGAAIKQVIDTPLTQYGASFGTITPPPPDNEAAARLIEVQQQRAQAQQAALDADAEQARIDRETEEFMASLNAKYPERISIAEQAVAAEKAAGAQLDQQTALQEARTKTIQRILEMEISDEQKVAAARFMRLANSDKAAQELLFGGGGAAGGSGGGGGGGGGGAGGGGAAPDGRNPFVAGFMGSYPRASEEGGLFDELLGQAGFALKYYAFYQVFNVGKEALSGIIDATKQYQQAVEDLSIALGTNYEQASHVADGYANIGSTLATAPDIAINAGAQFARSFRNADGSGDATAGTIGALVGSQANVIEGSDKVDQTTNALVALAKAFHLSADGAEVLYNRATQIGQVYGAASPGALLSGAAQVGPLAANSGFTPDQLFAAIAAASQATGKTPDLVGSDVSRLFGSSPTTRNAVLGSLGIDTVNQDVAHQFEALAAKLTSLPQDQAKQILETLGGARSSNTLIPFLEALRPAAQAGQVGSNLPGAADLAGDRLQKLGGQLQQLAADFKDLFTAIANGGAGDLLGLFVKGLDDTVKGLTAVIDGLNQFPTAAKDFVAAILTMLATMKLAQAINGGAGAGRVTNLLSAIGSRGLGRGLLSGGEAAAAEAATAEEAAAARGALGLGAPLALEGAAAGEAAAGAESATAAVTSLGTAAGAAAIALAPLLLIIGGLALAGEGAKYSAKVQTDQDTGSAAIKGSQEAIRSGDPAQLQTAITGLRTAAEALHKDSTDHSVGRWVSDNFQHPNNGYALDANGNLVAPQTQAQAMANRPYAGYAVNDPRAGVGTAPLGYDPRMGGPNPGGAPSNQLPDRPDSQSPIGRRQGENDINNAAAQAIKVQEDEQRRAAVLASLTSRSKAQEVFGDQFTDIGPGIAGLIQQGVSPTASGNDMGALLAHINTLGSKGRLSQGGTQELLDALAPVSGKGLADLVDNQLQQISKMLNPVEQQGAYAQVIAHAQQLVATAKASGDPQAIEKSTTVLQNVYAASDQSLLQLTQEKVNSIRAIQGINANSLSKIRSLLTSTAQQLAAHGDVNNLVTLLDGTDKAFIDHLGSTLSTEVLLKQRADATLALAQAKVAAANALLAVSVNGDGGSSPNIADRNLGWDPAYYGTGNAAAQNKAVTDAQKRLDGINQQIATAKTAQSTLATAKGLTAPTGTDFKPISSSGPTADQIDIARIQAREIPGDPLSAATTAIQVAQYQLSHAKDQQQYWQAVKALHDAQYQYGQVALNMATQNDLARIDITNPLAMAQEKVREAQRALAYDQSRGALGDVLQTDRNNLRQATSAAEKTAFDQKFSDEKTNYDLQRISLSAYLSYLQAQHNYLSSVHNKTRQQVDELNQVDQALQELNKQMEGQFNLGNIKVPSPYEVRRAMAAGGGAMTSVQNVNITINGNDLTAMKTVLGQYLGQGVTQSYATTTPKV